MKATVSLGSNIEPRARYLKRALDALAGFPETSLIRASAVIETDPVDVPEEFSEMKFLNQVAVFETGLEVHDFFARMQAAEDGLGRVRTIRNGPRTIDLDLISFGDLVLDEPDLVLPHPRAAERDFVQIPLRQIISAVSVFFAMLSPVSGAAVPSSSGAVTADRYPDADTVTIEEIEEVEYHADGTFRSTEESWTKVLTEAGRRELGVDSLDFNRRYGSGRFLEVVLFGEDGSRREIDIASAVKEMTDNSSAAANIYDPLDRRMICSIPGVRAGDVVYIRKERSTVVARCQNQWSDISVMEGFSPILKSVYRVKCPKELPVKRAVVRNPLGNITSSAVTNADGSVVLEWSAVDSPQAFPEPNMPAPYRQLQHVAVSTAADWREMSKWYWELCEPHLLKTNAQMAAMISSSPSAERLRRIFRFVSQEIRYMGLTMEDKSPGYAPHDVDITFGNRYGVCRDKAALLVAMLRLAGFEAYPVLIMAGSAKMDADSPSPYFNHAIAAVVPSADWIGEGVVGGYLLLDPTDESSRDYLPSYLSDCSFLVARPDGETLMKTPMPPAEKNLLSIDSDAELGENGEMFLKSAVRFRGLNDNAFRAFLLGMKPVERRRYFEQSVNAVYPGARLLRFDILPENLQDTTQPLSAAFSAEIPEALLTGATGAELRTGLLSSRLGIADMMLSERTALEKRRFPLRLSSTAGVDETLKVRLGDRVGEVKSLPSDSGFSGACGYALDCSVTNRELTVHRRLMINSLEFSPDEYSRLRENLKRVEAAERDKPVFAKNDLENADVRYLYRGVSVDFTGARSWVITNTLVRRILTYDGKKENSEMTFSFNPLWKKVRLLEAAVVNPGGKTAVVSANEINEFDCSWAASAPRYPASRRLVINLPSVETGSVITTVVESVVTSAPDEYRGTFFFDTVEPAEVFAIRIGNEKRVVSRPERIPLETRQPPGWFWRDAKTVARGDFAETAARLRSATAVDPVDPSCLEPAAESPVTVKSIRDWMSKYVRKSGPSLYELPLEKQLTDPVTVIAERYATRLDYIRTFCALLKGAGFDADIVFSADDATASDAFRKRIMKEYPDPSAFDLALCRVKTVSGGFLGFGGEVRTLFLGLENEYTPIGATALDGADFFDPSDGTFGKVSAAGRDFRSLENDATVITIRPNGAVDYDYERFIYGSGVGAFRRRYSEMLPEERSRHYQRLVGGVSQAASATGELETDVDGYPARLAFSCFVPDYAVVRGDVITITVPGLAGGPEWLGARRRSPVMLPATSPSRESWRVVFPEGYTRVERLPERLEIRDPLDPGKVRSSVEIGTKTVENHLEVEIVRNTFEYPEVPVARDYFPLLREWSRRNASPAAVTISVGRTED